MLARGQRRGTLARDGPDSRQGSLPTTVLSLPGGRETVQTRCMRRCGGDVGGEPAQGHPPFPPDPRLAAPLRPAWLRGDVAAGIAVTALIVPKNLGYAGIAGVPLQNGLYAAAAGAIIYALFCTSRQISTGPSSSLAAVAGGAVLVDRPRRRPGRAAGRGDHARDRASCSCCSPSSGWAGSRSSSPRPWSPDSSPARRSTSSIGELPKLTGTSAEGDNAWRELGSWLAVARRRALDDAARRRRRAGA